jgi:DNA recombination protein RmuC
MYWVYLTVGAVTGFVIGYLIVNQKLKGLQIASEQEKEKAVEAMKNEKLSLEKELEVMKERINNLKEENEKLNAELNKETLRRENAENSNAALRSDYKHLSEKLETQKEEMERMQERFKTEFENIANKILKENTKEFSESSHKNMSELLNPLKEKISDFEKKVEETYQKGLRDQTDLKAELKKLHELNTKLGEEAGNLTKALKSDTKQQGNWGEVVLERILERSGLIKDEEYFLQYSVKNEEGKNLRPDVLIKLPENKHLIIDSKVSLTAFEEYISAGDEAARQRALKRHLDSVKNHVKELYEKSYDKLKDLKTPDFVLMFMPVEPAFAVAVQSDKGLFNFAWEKRVVIVSPTTLLATLRTVASIWRHERQTRNALEISRQGAKLYEKFVGFLTDLEKVGANIDKAREAFDDAKKKLSTGRGNLIGQVEKLRELGVKPSKQIDKNYLEE